MPLQRQGSNAPSKGISGIRDPDGTAGGDSLVLRLSKFERFERIFCFRGGCWFAEKKFGLILHRVNLRC